MLSRVLARSAEGSASPGSIEPMVFEQIGGPRVSPAKPTLPADSCPEHIAADFERKIAELQNTIARTAAESRQTGFREGEAHGTSQANAAIQPVMDEMCRAVQVLADLKPRLRREAESDVVKLAIAIARRILHRELTVDPAAMQALVQVALEKLGRQEVYRVRVHSSHEDAIRSCLSKLTTRKIEVLGDSSRESGSLVFETNRGKLDASVETQLEEIERGLADRVHER